MNHFILARPTARGQHFIGRSVNQLPRPAVRLSPSEKGCSVASRSSCRYAGQGASVTLGFGAVHDSYETKQQALEAQSRTKQAKMAENAIFFSLRDATGLYTAGWDGNDDLAKILFSLHFDGFPKSKKQGK